MLEWNLGHRVGHAVRLTLGTALVIILMLGTARAQFEVQSPLVEEGELELEGKGSFLWGYEDSEEDADADDEDEEEEAEEEEEEEEDQRQGHEVSIGYGVTDFWRTEVGVEIEQNIADPVEVKSVAFENIFQILPEDSFFANLGFFAAYEGPIDDDASHSFEFGPIIQIPLGPVVTTLNPFFEKQFGKNREKGVAFEYGVQTLVTVTEDIALGVEAFGEIENFAGERPKTSDQEHRIGPVAVFGIDLGSLGELGIETGLFFGLTEGTSDYAAKINLEWELPFGDDD